MAGGYLLPDLMLVEPLPRTEQPTSALLVVETAQTSQARDREKARDYAAAGVPEYWVVDLAARAVEVRRRPLAGRSTAEAGQSLTPLVGDAPAVDVTALLG